MFVTPSGGRDGLVDIGCRRVGNVTEPGAIAWAVDRNGGGSLRRARGAVDEDASSGAREEVGARIDRGGRGGGGGGRERAEGVCHAGGGTLGEFPVLKCTESNESTLAYIATKTSIYSRYPN